MSSFQGLGLATALLAASGAVAIASWGYISARRRKGSDQSDKRVQVEDKEDGDSIPPQAAGKGADPTIEAVQVVDQEGIGSAVTKGSGNGADIGCIPVHVVAEALGFVAAQGVGKGADLGNKLVQVDEKGDVGSLATQAAGKGEDLIIESVQVVDQEGIGSAVTKVTTDTGFIPVHVVAKEELGFVVAQGMGKGAGLDKKQVQVADKDKLVSVPTQEVDIRPDPSIKSVQMIDKQEMCFIPDQDMQVMDKGAQDAGKVEDAANIAAEVEVREELGSVPAHDGGKRADTHLSKAHEDHNTKRDLGDNGTVAHTSTLVHTDETPLEKVNSCTSEIQTKGKSSQVLVLGLDGSGKTSVLNTIAANKGKLIPTPTEGVNAMCVSNGSSKMEFLEIGGSEQLRPYWKMYLSRAFAVIFVVDSADHSRLPLAKRHLHQLIQQDSVLPLIVLANKQDLSNAHHITDIHEALALSEICENRKLFLIGTHVTKEGDDISSGIQDTKEFLAQLQS